MSAILEKMKMNFTQDMQNVKNAQERRTKKPIEFIIKKMGGYSNIKNGV
jgi:hypothetical protein